MLLTTINSHIRAQTNIVIKHNQSSSSVSCNWQWTAMAFCWPVLCGIGEPCQWWGDQRVVSVDVTLYYFWVWVLLAIFDNAMFQRLWTIFVVENCIFNGRNEFYAWSHFKNKKYHPRCIFIGGCRQVENRWGSVAEEDDSDAHTQWNRILSCILCRSQSRFSWSTRDLHSSGAFYVTNPQTSKALVEASRTTHFVWIDDAWVITVQYFICYVFNLFWSGDRLLGRNS